jgi:hypothetical protein
LDIIIAVFGGIAGIVSIARKDIAITLPGVAIATALMPPLCVAGFGLAHGDFAMAIKAFYLFFLNTFFVALATYAIVRLLKFPLREYVDAAERRRNLLIIGLVIMAAVVPSFLIFRNVLSDMQQNVKIERFINQYIGEDEIYLDEYEVVITDTINWLIMKVYGNEIAPDRIAEFNQGLVNTGLKNTRIKIISTSEVDISDIRLLSSKLSRIEEVTADLEESDQQRKNREMLEQYLKERMPETMIDSSRFAEVTDEVRILFPDLLEFAVGIMQNSTPSGEIQNYPVTLVSWDKKVKRSQITEDESKMQNYLKMRLDLDTIMLVRN